MLANDTNSSDAHDANDDQSVHEEHLDGSHNQNQEDLSITTSKITTGQDKLSEVPGIDVNINSSTPTERASDATSVRSLPIVQVSEPTSPGPRPATAVTSEFASTTVAEDRDRAISPSPRTTRADRRRTAVLDNRATNRFSGFFSNLIHRRDVPPGAPGRTTPREGRPESPLPPSANPETPSRSSSPAAPVRPQTPPPSLPPPTLGELGLTMSMVTSILSPSHFSSPPTSGAFLSPHYLLLCHAQGLDVLPLTSPPAPIPYALVRRVPFKNVVVMEQRGVLVAIAGRRDGVRVYALDEVRKAVEWRIEVELRRERERARREEAKRVVSASFDDSDRGSEDKVKVTPSGARRMIRKLSSASSNAPSSRSVTPKKPTSTAAAAPPLPPVPRLDEPPPYSQAHLSERRASAISAHQLVQRSPQINSDVIPRDAMSRHNTTIRPSAEYEDSKPDWGSSDDEAIDIVAAGSSGSQALDERTSAMANVSASSPPRVAAPSISHAPTTQSQTARRRPANLDLSLTRVGSNTATTTPPPPSPTPTLLTLRQALQAHPSNNVVTSLPGAADHGPEPSTPVDDDDEAEGRGTPTENVSLAQMLLESRLPNLPPVGTRRPQHAILISSHPLVTGEDQLPSPRPSESTVGSGSVQETNNRRRRRWSVFDGIFQAPAPPMPQSRAAASSVDVSVAADSPTPLPTSNSRPRTHVRRQSARVPTTTSDSTIRPSVSTTSSHTRPSTSPSTPTANSPPPRPPSRSSRFIPRVISNAFSGRRPDSPTPNTLDIERVKALTTPTQAHAPAPKLEYVKLPGTKGALLIKAVETAKKSFLAILCGEHGEKVELFAGTYRTALGLSRTFILPDSPRSLELQLQGDDLVEVFLVFSQNVFGLEPATVRVREVRIGRAERRAARRRARDRENLLDEPPSTADPEAVVPEEETNVTVTMTVAPAGPESDQATPLPQNTDEAGGTQATAEELAVLAATQVSPYTTFQQLSFAPNFPLASIADEYIIPPTYPSFLEYRTEHESESEGAGEASTSALPPPQLQLPPPGLPLPVSSPPCQWFYRDPKGVVHGPWKSSLMQTWYKDGLLPPDLPVRRDHEADYVLLRELRLQCVDPAQPFGSVLPQIAPPATLNQTSLLKPISLLAQPAHFGPPALFFSSRGGHSTTIVDSRGRLVLKGRFFWSQDEETEDEKGGAAGSNVTRMGDIKRLEAIDMHDRSVLVAMRQGGLEAVDLSDALLRPADGSRTLFPHFDPPTSSTNRRTPFVWKMGTPITGGALSAGILPLKHSAPRGNARKASTGPGKSPGRTDFLHGTGEAEGEHPIQDEILFMGRKNDDLYLCERNSGSFRILRLCPSYS